MYMNVWFSCCLCLVVAGPVNDLQGVCPFLRAFLSSCHPVILSSCHPVILSQCHPMKNTIKTCYHKPEPKKNCIVHGQNTFYKMHTFYPKW